MGGIFNLDSKFMQGANKFADLMILNIVTLICCIPIFTIGAAMTAMHNVLLKIYRGEENYILKQYFKSFKENFKQSTIIFILYVLIVVFLIMDFLLINDGIVQMPKFIKYVLYIVTALTAISYVWVFPIQSRYVNKIRTTLRNTMVISISKIWYSVMMLLFTLIPLLAIYYFEVMIPVVFLFGFTAPGILQTILYSKVFDKLEGVDRKALKEQQQEDDGWTVELEEEEGLPQTEETKGETVDAESAVTEEVNAVADEEISEADNSETEISKMTEN